ncbi:MAG TPA: DUF3826 domain-containing protein [Chitinophagaceae bacterium]|nr:DUF3826 domain-containing protein [Chitinophagaceae bacterium]
MKVYLLLISILFTSSVCVFGQSAITATDEDATYTRTITTRSEKIVSTLEISDPSTEKNLVSLIANQYRNLNTIYEERDLQVKTVKEKNETNNAMETELKKIESSTNEKISALHTTFISALSSSLSPDQVVKVKDGMTYNVLSVTYHAYVDMIPSLKKEEREQIMAWLVEARELAMDAESSEKKHWWFGKYKGRINNYLSAQGYNITEERQAWEKRKNLKQSGTH